MKRLSYPLILFVVSMVAMVSCGGGGGDGGGGVPESRTPSISNFQFTPTSSRFASGLVNVRGSIDFFDSGGDIKKIYIIVIQYTGPSPGTGATSYGYGYPSGTWGNTLNVSNFPLTWYRNEPFYIMRTDALDRFGTRLEQRFTKDEISQMLIKTGFEKIKFSDREPFWTVLAYKKQ